MRRQKEVKYMPLFGKKAQEAKEKLAKEAAEAKAATEAKAAEIKAEAKAQSAIAEAKAAEIKAKAEAKIAEAKAKAEAEVKEAAEAAYTAAIDTLFTKIGANNSGDINTGKAKVIEEYEADIHDILVAEYNEEIKKNLATELWSLIQSSTKDLTVDNLPGEAVENAYDRIYSRYQYLFYNGKYDDGDSSTTDTDSNYSKYYGIFEDYLMVETSTKTVADAEAEVLKQAKEHVLISVTVFAAAEALNLELTKDEIKDLNRPGNDYLVEYYGEDNVQTAAQFDKILNHLLEIEEEPDANDVDVYKNIKWAPKTEE